MINLTKDFRCSSDDILEDRLKKKPAKVIQGTFEGGLVSGIYKSRTIISKQQPEYPVQKQISFEYETTTGD